jgi:hypothetical protein
MVVTFRCWFDAYLLSTILDVNVLACCALHCLECHELNGSVIISLIPIAKHALRLNAEGVIFNSLTKMKHKSMFSVLFIPHSAVEFR